MDKQGVVARRVTIRDVAREAAVSVSTVSHVLSGKRPSSADTRERVNDAIARLGYRPNAIAQGLVWQRSFAIGLVVPDIANPYYPALARAVEDRVHLRGYSLVLGNTDFDAAREKAYLDLLDAGQLGGLIYTAAGEIEEPVRERLRRAAAHGTPVVLVHAPMEGLPSVAADNRQGARLAAEHLLSLGHRRIGIISAKPINDAMADREEAFRQALSLVGISGDNLRVAYGDHHIEGGRRASRTLLQQSPDDGGVTALFVLNDLMALGALDAARDRGRKVPDDLSICGFDGIPFAALAAPPLTTVAQPIRLIGERAAELLLAQIERPLGRRQDALPAERLPNRLVVRSSTGPAPAPRLR